MTKPAQKQRSLKAVVGQQTYSVWVALPHSLVPEGRTHRLAWPGTGKQTDPPAF